MAQDGGGRVDFERLTTGVRALDEILEGGVPKYSITIIAGAPGTGKTILCQQALFANARSVGSVLYLGTLAEPVVKMVRYAERFSFFNPDMVGREVAYGDLGAALVSQGGAGVLAEIEELVMRNRPELLIIDSFKAIREHFESAAGFRNFLTELAARLVAWEVTSLFVGEYGEEDIALGPEFGIADGIIFLYGTHEPARQKRFLRVMKMRGTDFFAGEHFFEISSSGLEVYPRMDPGIAGEYTAPTGRVPSKIAGLSEMLNGGLPNSTAALLIGGSGTGKTLVALSFVVAAGEERKSALFVSLEESPDQITRNCAAFGWPLDRLAADGLLDIYHVSPAELDIDRHAILFKQRADAIKAQCVVIDTVTAVEASLLDRARYQNYLWTIVSYFKRIGVTVIMTHESTAQTEYVAGGTGNVLFLADVIVNLKLIEVDGTFRRTLNVLKMRGNAHDHSLRELVIQVPEIYIDEVFQRTGSDRDFGDGTDDARAGR
jgi:circadian clock protein KaiC